MTKKLKQQLKETFAAPPVTRKNLFLKEFPYPKTPIFEFALTQIGYIRKRFWLLSILLMLLMVLIIPAYHVEFKTVGILSVLLPFLVLLSTMEISKSTSYHMEELEMCCKYNLGRITLIRLIVIGSFHLVISLAMILLFARYSEFSFLPYALYSLTPFLFCAYSSLFIMNHLGNKDSLYICGGVAATISFGTFGLTNNFEMVYANQFIVYWAIAFIITIILLILEVKKLMKRTEELQWNSQLIT